MASAWPLLRGALVAGPDPCKRPLPVTAKLCYAHALILLLAAIWALGACPISPARKAEKDHLEIFRTAGGMLVPALMLELSHLLSSGICNISIRLSAVEMTRLVIVEYFLLSVTYLGMGYFDGVIVHTNMRNTQQDRPIYTVRWLGWLICLPLFIYLCNHPLSAGMGSGQFWHRVTPMATLTFAYTLSTWVGAVVQNDTIGFMVIAFSYGGWLLTCVDQVALLSECYSKMAHPITMCVVIFSRDVVFLLYGLAFLGAVCGQLSPYTVQLLFTCGDVFCKSVEGSVLLTFRNWGDITTIERLGARVFQNLEDMSAFVQQATVPMLSLDSYGQLVMWNEQMENMTRVPSADVIGKKLEDYLHSSCHEVVQNAIVKSSRGEATSSMELVFNVKDTMDQVRILMNFVIQKGLLSGDILGIGQDLTEVVNLKAAEERRARFTAITSHELRSPLHGITGLTAAMANSVQDPTARRQLNMIKNCAVRLLDLVTNIMEMSHQDSRKGLSECPRPSVAVNIMNIVDEVVSLTTMATDKSLKPLLKPEVELINGMRTGKLPLVPGDAFRLTQLFYNLITNAVKFTAHGSVTLTAKHIAAESRLEISVTDTGRGIAPESLERIFVPFEQETSTDASSFQGIGLGLSVARGIAKMHGGAIKVSSQVGVGSTFMIQLPCINEHTEGLTSPGDDVKQLRAGQLAEIPATTPLPDVPAKPELASKGRKPLILLVDDDELCLEVIFRALMRDFRLVKVSDGSAAIQYLTSAGEQPSLMLLDLMMPGMSGFDVLKEVRGRLRMPQLRLPIIAISAMTPSEHAAKQAFECGATDFMSKPFQAATLRERLKALIQLLWDATSTRLSSPSPQSKDADLAVAVANVASNVSREADERLSAMEAELALLREAAAAARKDAAAAQERLRDAEAAAAEAKEAAEEASSEVAIERAKVARLEGELTLASRSETWTGESELPELEVVSRTNTSPAELFAPGRRSRGLPPEKQKKGIAPGEPAKPALRPTSTSPRSDTAASADAPAAGDSAGAGWVKGAVEETSLTSGSPVEEGSNNRSNSRLRFRIPHSGQT